MSRDNWLHRWREGQVIRGPRIEGPFARMITTQPANCRGVELFVKLTRFHTDSRIIVIACSQLIRGRSSPRVSLQRSCRIRSHFLDTFMDREVSGLSLMVYFQWPFRRREFRIMPRLLRACLSLLNLLVRLVNLKEPRRCLEFVSPV